jgi:terminase small subunit / prophage DNA-packing protein
VEADYSADSIGSAPHHALRQSEWPGVLRTVRAGMLAVLSRAAQRLPHLTAHDVTMIDREVRDVLTEIGNDS